MPFIYIFFSSIFTCICKDLRDMRRKKVILTFSFYCVLFFFKICMLKYFFDLFFRLLGMRWVSSASNPTIFLVTHTIKFIVVTWILTWFCVEMFICQSLRKLWCRNIIDHVKETFHGLTPSRTIYTRISFKKRIAKFNTSRIGRQGYLCLVWINIWKQ